jgi:hypothetical protein
MCPSSGLYVTLNTRYNLRKQIASGADKPPCRTEAQLCCWTAATITGPSVEVGAVRRPVRLHVKWGRSQRRWSPPHPTVKTSMFVRRRWSGKTTGRGPAANEARMSFCFMLSLLSELGGGKERG